jgi:hypothetical protein
MTITRDDLAASGIGETPSMLGGIEYDAASGVHKIQPAVAYGGSISVVDAGVASSYSDNREIAALDSSASQKVSWSVGVTELVVTAFGEVAGTPELRAAFAVCFDAPSDLVASDWLAGGASETIATYRFVIPVGIPRVFRFSSGINRLDAIRVFGSETLSLFVEAGR